MDKMHLPIFATKKPKSMSNEEWNFEHQQKGASLSNHLNEFQGILDQMSKVDIKFEDEILGLLLLNSLLESWETFKVSITNSTPNDVVSLQMTKGSVLNEEMRRRAQGSSSWFKKEENKGKNGKSKEKDHDDDDVVTIATGDDLVILRDFELISLVFNESMHIIDSSATLHVTLRKEFFISYTSSDFGLLKMSNDDVIKVIGVGDICLQTNMGVQLWLTGVKHAPNIRFNLIFVHMLDGGGYDNHFGYGKWKLTIGNLVLSRTEKIYKLYWTKALVAKDSVNVMDIETKVSFKKHHSSRKSELLELVYSDVCGPLKEVLDPYFELKGASDHVKTKLVKSRDVQFMEDQTIEDIDKQLGDGFDVPPDNDVEEEQEMSQDKNSDGEELECYQEAMESEKRQKSLCFGGDKSTLVGYSNLDMVGDIDYKKSTSSYLIKFGGRVVAWHSKLKKCVTRISKIDESP
ncbi:hypothetical protein CR513_30083, partial [Mucuna pruriens]